MATQRTLTLMLIEHFGGVPIPTVSPEIGAGMWQAAESHFRTRYKPGVYRDASKINEMIQYHFAFFEKRLKQLLLIPKIASRDFMEFVLHIYDLASSVEA